MLWYNIYLINKSEQKLIINWKQKRAMKKIQGSDIVVTR